MIIGYGTEIINVKKLDKMAHSYTENRQPIIKLIKNFNPKTILDVGLGAGDYGQPIKHILPDSKLIGLDVWEEYKTPQWDYYDEIVISDMREFTFPKVDLTLFIDSLEHIEKADAWKVLTRVPNPILVSIPINYIQPPDVDFYDKHRAEWTINDFKGMEYKDYSNERSLILWFQSLSLSGENIKNI